MRGRSWLPPARQRAGREHTDGDRHGGTRLTRRHRHRGEVPRCGIQPAATYRGVPEGARPVAGGPGLSFPGTVLGLRCPCEAGSSFPVLRSGRRCAAPHRALPSGCGVWYGEHWLTIAQVYVQTVGFGVSVVFLFPPRRIHRKSSRVLVPRGEEKKRTEVSTKNSVD